MSSQSRPPEIPTRAVTKLRPPTLHSGVLERSHLTELFDRAVASPQPLILVSAPAGAGKSTALADWARRTTQAVTAWIQLDSSDNDPIRFWSTVAAAASEVDPQMPRAVQPALRTPKSSFTATALPVLVNRLDRATARFAIVVDDYHVIRNPELHDGLQHLLTRLPPHVTVALSTRADPPLRLARLRANGDLCEVRADELRFTSADAACFFADADVSTAAISTLCHRTEGWAAGLALAAASLARSPDPSSFVSTFAGSDYMIVDYLGSELLDQLPTTTRERMLATSILDQLSGPLVDAVVGDPPGEGRAWLEQLARDNQLLIALDSRHGWYRYHHLLRDLLRSELDRAGTTRVESLHARAAQWYVEHGELDEAIRHHLAAGDRELAADLIGREGSKVFSEGQLMTVQAWLDELGHDLVESTPWCAVLQVWTLVLAGEFDQVAPWVEAARGLLDTGGAGDDAPLLTGSLAAAAALTAVAAGDIGGAVDSVKIIVASPEDHQPTPLIEMIIGVCHTWAGHDDEAVPALERAARTAPADGEYLIAATAHMYLAVVAMEAGNEGLARAEANGALGLAEEHHLTEYTQLATAHGVRALTDARSDPDGSARHGDRGVELARRSHQLVPLVYALAARACASTERGDLAAARTDLGEARALTDRCIDPGIVLTFLARCEAHLGSVPSGSRPRPRPIGTQALVDPLTDRELTVLRLLSSRLTVREIAGELSVSPNTAKGHIKAIYRKLGVNQRSLAVQRARELKLR